jgi:hypothetical protein
MFVSPYIHTRQQVINLGVKMRFQTGFPTQGARSSLEVIKCMSNWSSYVENIGLLIYYGSIAQEAAYIIINYF